MTSSLSRIWTITAGATLLQGANGLLQALLPLHMQAEGLPVTAIGTVATAYGFGFAAGCFLAPPFVRDVGHIRAFASLAAIAAIVALVFTQAHSVVTWAVLRAISGATLAGLFTVIDSWVSDRGDAGNRGRMLSIYMICTKVALMLSPLGIGLGSIGGHGLFMTVAAMMCLSLLPVSGAISEAPRPPGTVRLELRALFSVAPSAVVAAFAAGLTNGPVVAMAPVYGVGVGLSADQAAILLVALQAGSLALQWPLGWLSDHVDRRSVIGSLAAGTFGASAVILWASFYGVPWMIIGAFALWGGLALCVYAVCVAHACDLVAAERIVPTIGTLLTCWAVGATVGPVIGAGLMELIGPEGLFIYAGSVSLALTAFVIMRMLWRTRGAAKGGFVYVPQTSPATATLSPRAEVASGPPGTSSERPP